jgi:hypothetical protein
MGNVVKLNQPQSATEAERQRFEKWASSDLRGPMEASTLLARSRGGEYVLGTARAAWAAWQARGMMMIAKGDGNLSHPRERVIALESAAQAICQFANTDPADGTMLLLTAAVHLAKRHAAPETDITVVLAESLGYAFVAASDFFKND